MWEASSKPASTSGGNPNYPNPNVNNPNPSNPNPNPNPRCSRVSVVDHAERGVL